MLIEQTRAILMPRLKFSEKFDHPFLHVFIFGNMFRERHSFVAMPITIDHTKQCLFDRINNAFKLCCSIRTKTLSPKNTTKPWILGEICANIKKRQNYYSHDRQNKMSHQFYSRFKKFVPNKIREAKINYFARKFQQFKGDCKSTWKQINSIILPIRINKRNIINKMSENDITYET